jgi:hypothetical protein
MSKDKPKRPRRGLAYRVLVIIALLAACFLILPIGLEVRKVFHILTNALGGQK